MGPEGHFWSPEAALDPEVPIRTQRLSKDPKVVWEPGDNLVDSWYRNRSLGLVVCGDQ